LCTRRMALPDSLAIGWNTVVSVLAILLIDTYIVWTIYSYRRLRAFDGPLWASVSQSWLAQKTFSVTLYETSADISRKYGACVWSWILTS
jgi:hypothetical protein